VALDRVRVKYEGTSAAQQAEWISQASRLGAEHELVLKRLETGHLEAVTKMERSHAESLKKLEVGHAEQTKKLADQLELVDTRKAILEGEEADRQARFEAQQARTAATSVFNLDVQARELKMRLEEASADVDDQVKVLEKLKGPICELFAAVNDRETMVRVAEALSLNRMLDDDTGTDIIDLLRTAGLGGAATQLLEALESRKD